MENYIFEIDPKNKEIKKIPLTKDIKMKLGRMDFFCINNTGINIYFSTIEENNSWTLDLPELPKVYYGSYQQYSFKGICYLAGEQYQINDEEWKVLRFPHVYSTFFENSGKWVKF